jgi:hypothetical protein
MTTQTTTPAASRCASGKPNEMGTDPGSGAVVPRKRGSMTVRTLSECRAMLDRFVPADVSRIIEPTCKRFSGHAHWEPVSFRIHLWIDQTQANSPFHFHKESTDLDELTWDAVYAYAAWKVLHGSSAVSPTA